MPTASHPSALRNLLTAMVAFTIPVGCTQLSSVLPGASSTSSSTTVTTDNAANSGTTAAAKPAATTPTAAKPAATTPTATQLATVKTNTATDAQISAQVQQDMSDLDTLGDNILGFGTKASIGRSSRGQTIVVRKVVTTVIEVQTRQAARKVTAPQKTQLQQRQQQVKQKAAPRLSAALEALKQHMSYDVETNELGGQTYTFDFDVTNKDGSHRTGEMVRIYDSDRTLVASSQYQDATDANGNPRHMEQTKNLQDDGSYVIKGTANWTRNGLLHTFTWTKTISPDGKVTGSGSIDVTPVAGASPTPTPTPTATPTASPTPEASESPSSDATASPSPEATPTPEPSASDAATETTVTIDGTEGNETTTVTDPASQTSASVDSSAETGTDTTATVTSGGQTSDVTVDSGSSVTSDLGNS